LERSMDIEQRYYQIGIRRIYLLVIRISSAGVEMRRTGSLVLLDGGSPSRILRE